MKEEKNLLNENTIRRFMTLANIGTIGQGFTQKLNEQEGMLEDEDEEDFEMGDDAVMADMPAEEPAEDMEDLGGEEATEAVTVEVDPMALAQGIAAEMEKHIDGVDVDVTDADEEEDMEDLEGLEDLGGMGEMPEEAMMENYIRQRVRQALLQEKKSQQAPSAVDERAVDLYKARMQSIAKKVYDQSRADVIKESKLNAFSDEVQRRVASRILKSQKK